MRGGIDLAREKPLLGWGAGAFNAEYRGAREELRPRGDVASHTIPITVAAEQGIVGLAAYVALLVAGVHAAAARRAWRRPCGRRSRPASPRSSLHTWLYAAFLEDPVTWTLLALGTALACPPGASRREPDEDAAAALNGHRREAVVVARSATS